MPKVTEEYRIARRDEIADAALRAFRRKGFQATSMAEIIAESGLSAGAIYGHFPSKSSIVVEVATRVVDARIADIEHLSDLTPMPAPPTLPRVLVDAMMHALGSPGIMLQLWGEGITDPEVGQLTSSVIERLRVTLTLYVSLWHQRTHGVAPEEAARLAAEQVPLFIACVQGYVIQSSLIPGFDGEAYLGAVEKYLPR